MRHLVTHILLVFENHILYSVPFDLHILFLLEISWNRRNFVFKKNANPLNRFFLRFRALYISRSALRSNYTGTIFVLLLQSFFCGWRDRIFESRESVQFSISSDATEGTKCGHMRFRSTRIYQVICKQKRTFQWIMREIRNKIAKCAALHIVKDRRMHFEHCFRGMKLLQLRQSEIMFFKKRPNKFHKRNKISRKVLIWN